MLITVFIHCPSDKEDGAERLCISENLFQSTIDQLKSSSLNYTHESENNGQHIYLQADPQDDQDVAMFLCCFEEDVKKEAEEDAAYQQIFGIQEENGDDDHGDDDHEEEESEDYDAEADGDEWPEKGPWARN